MRCASAGPMAPCSRRFPATSPWPGSRRSRLWPRGARPGSSASVEPRRISPMLSSGGCAARRERLWNALPAACDVLVVGDPSHLIYFAGYDPSPFVFRTVESGPLLLPQRDRPTLLPATLLTPSL